MFAAHRFKVFHPHVVSGAGAQQKAACLGPATGDGVEGVQDFFQNAIGHALPDHHRRQTTRFPADIARLRARRYRLFKHRVLRTCVSEVLTSHMPILPLMSARRHGNRNGTLTLRSRRALFRAIAQWCNLED